MRARAPYLPRAAPRVLVKVSSVHTLPLCCRRLDERERRRNFIVQHNLVRVKHFQAQERSLAPQERDMLGRLRVFARFQTTPGEHEELVEGVLLEQRLRARVQVRWGGAGAMGW